MAANNKRAEEDRAAAERSRHDDPTRETGRQIDDNQDDLGRDVNDPSRTPDEVKRDRGRRSK